jgi:hypothetical protein
VSFGELVEELQKYGRDIQVISPSLLKSGETGVASVP